jgi:hypothetical protein
MSDMSNVGLNKNEAQAGTVDLTQNNPSNTKTSNKYQPLKKDENKTNNYPILSKLKIILEFSFILFAFFLALKKAIDSITKKGIHDMKNLGYKNLAPDEKKIRKTTSSLKICVCTVGKKENRYIREFIEFYKNNGVDKIFLYDNNKVDGEKFNEVINDYINSSFVDVLDWRGNSDYLGMLNDCYKKNNQSYDWLIFYDIDEYIHLKHYANIKPFLNEEKFDNCKKIYLNRVFHTDNNLLLYDNRTLQVRFPTIESKPLTINNESILYVKSIIRGNLTNIAFNCKYKLVTELKGCNGYGKDVDLLGLNLDKPDFENYYIDHYFYKSLEEFMEKLNDVGYDSDFKNEAIGRFFQHNNITIEKIDYIENKTRMNLSFYKNYIK